MTSPTSPIGIAPEAASPANEQASSAELEISVGDEVDQIIARFGEPMMALKGITGKDYTEKYLFRTADRAADYRPSGKRNRDSGPGRRQARRHTRCGTVVAERFELPAASPWQKWAALPLIA